MFYSLKEQAIRDYIAKINFKQDWNYKIIEENKETGLIYILKVDHEVNKLGIIPVRNQRSFTFNLNDVGSDIPHREIFPKGRLPSGELGRQSPKELQDKFVWFFKTYPEYDWDLILDVTEFYVDTFSKKNYLYMASSSYFIKKTLPTKEVCSKLADYCQQVLDNPDLLK